MKKKAASKRPSQPAEQPKPPPTYHVTLVRSAEKEFLALPDDRLEAVAERLQLLKRDPRPPGAAKLTGRTEYKLRVGDLRIIYAIHDTSREVVVMIIDDRKQVYRRLRQRT